MTPPHDHLVWQFDMAWQLAGLHLESLSTDECLWRPAERGLHVHQLPDGRWRADWPEHERYDLGPPSIAWTTWHLGFWWSMVLDHSFGAGTLSRDDVYWPGSADGVRAWLTALHRDWRERITGLDAHALQSPEHTRWPFQERPFGDVIAWATVELVKNGAEIGYGRFLHAVAR